jgi:Flp pilus assembly protein TadD
LHHALGLALTRLQQVDAALTELRRAAELEPGRERYAYVYAVALHSSGRRDKALTVLKALAKHPDDRDTLMALTRFSHEAGDIGNALEYARRLERVSPNPELARLIEELRRQTTKPNPRDG